VRDGAREEAEEPDREHGHLVATRELDGRGGPWTLELLYGDEVVHTASIAAAADTAGDRAGSAARQSERARGATP
jgi:hypothetical protein